MKKVSVIFLTFIYLIVASGLTFNLHYCGGKISDISLWKSEIDNCCGGKKVMKKNCCENKISVLKIKDTQYSSSSLQLPVKSVKIIDASYPLFSLNPNKIFEIKINSTVHDPPDIYKNPIFLQYGVLLI